MLNKVERFIRKHRLLSHKFFYLIGVSGGADSVCLLLIMQRLGYRIRAVHCNFKLRGAESDRDEAFVVNLCKKLNVDLSITHFDTRTYATTHKVSIEMAARALRYRYFEQLRQDVEAQGICVAHHREDSVETVLMNLIRGTGIEGLTGIKLTNNHVIRPLLGVTRKEILEWLDAQGQEYMTDSTNNSTDFLRNRLRLDILPRLEEALPGATASIHRSSERLLQASMVYHEAMREKLKKLIKDDSIDIGDLVSDPGTECILYEWLSPLGFSPATITNIFYSNFEQGSQWLSATHILYVHQDRIIVARRQDNPSTLRIPETGTYVYEGNTRFSVKTVSGGLIITDSNTASLDADTVAFPLTLRAVQQGDRFVPYGMKGSKLVSDFLTDRKVSIIDKRRQLVLTDAHDRIIWLVGLRPDGRFCVSQQTRNTLLITQSSEEQPSSQQS